MRINKINSLIYIIVYEIASNFRLIIETIYYKIRREEDTYGII